jgi:hypothetical protein
MPDVCEIYALKDPDNGQIRYIGKANNSAKRLQSHFRDAKRRNTPVYCWIRKLLIAGKTPQLEVLLVCQKDAWPQYERSLIAEYRASGSRLLNVADGGDEPAITTEQRRANAYKLNDNIVVEWRQVLCEIGRLRARSIKSGKTHLLERLDKVQEKLRAMTQDERIEFAYKMLVKKGKIQPEAYV